MTTIKTDFYSGIEAKNYILLTDVIGSHKWAKEIDKQSLNQLKKQGKLTKYKTPEVFNYQGLPPEVKEYAASDSKWKKQYVSYLRKEELDNYFSLET